MNFRAIFVIFMAGICTACTGAMSVIEDDAKVVVEDVIEDSIEDVIDKRIAIFLAKSLAVILCSGALLFSVRHLAIKECKRLSNVSSDIKL